MARIAHTLMNFIKFASGLFYASFHTPKKCYHITLMNFIQFANDLFMLLSLLQRLFQSLLSLLEPYVVTSEFAFFFNASIVSA
jgi:hypothetical protein